MPQTENASLPSLGAIPEACRDALGLWLNESSTGPFPPEEQVLHRSVALSYADPRRPSMRALYKSLEEMIALDETRTGKRLRRPSFEAFRHIVLTLPSAFIDHMRYGQQISTWEIIKNAEAATVAAASPNATAH